MSQGPRAGSLAEGSLGDEQVGTDSRTEAPKPRDQEATPLLVARGLSKSFGATKAMQGVDLTVFPGECVVIVGENGAGKSTLMKTLAGVIQPDLGHMVFCGNEYHPSSPAEAISAGVSIVHQEPTFFPQLSVLENIFMGREVKSRFGNLRWGPMRDEGQALFEKLQIPVRLLERRMEELSLGEQQLALIARAIHQDARLLILDEPTSILTDSEAELLFSLLDGHTSRGGGLLYISHRMNEFDRVGDRILVLKDGCLVGELNVSQANEAKLIQLMSGRDIAAYEHVGERAVRSEQPVLSVRNLCKQSMYSGINLDVHAGEVVGLYGLMGSGRTEIALTVFGQWKPDSGTMSLDARSLRPRNPAEAMKRGIAYIPEDRKALGIYPLMSCEANLSSAILPRLTRRGFIRRSDERAAVLAEYRSLSIKSRDPEQSILDLSGGNQQKVLLARWLATGPRLLLLDEPTRGIDVATKSELHRLIRSQANTGIGVLLISSELPELLALSDRVYVLHQGAVTAELPGGQGSEEAVLRATMGVTVGNG